jgi:geranylgeranyl diphosphate synthase, type II
MKEFEKHLALVEDFLSDEEWGLRPPSLYEPIRYIMSLGGKRLRPLLTMLSYSLYKKDAENIIPQAAAVELFHNFTLVHDDIMDKAPLRRGKATVHEKWNVNTAILSGDVMMVKVYEIFSVLEPKMLKDVLLIFNQCATEVCEGQQWDMEFESKKTVSVPEYLEMIRQKTAVLLGFSLELGALLAGAKLKERLTLRNLGVSIGIGFQLNDDLLDVYGDKKKFGKQVGGDIISNKKTFLLIKALERAKGKDKIELMKWLTAKTFDKTKKVKAVTALYDKLEIRQIAETEINNQFSKGLQSLAALPATSGRDELGRFIFSLMKRQS